MSHVDPRDHDVLIGAAAGQPLPEDMTAIGPYASADRDGDIAIACRPDGSEQLTIRKVVSESVIPGPLRRVAEGASETLVRTLWREDSSPATRGLVLQRLFDRMDDFSRRKALETLILEGLDISRTYKRRP